MLEFKIPLWSGKHEKFFVYVKESKRGLETSVSDDVHLLHDSYKKQVVAFLIDVIHKLEPKREVKK